VPEQPPKHRPHPSKRDNLHTPAPRDRPQVAYAELQTVSNFSFLRGASHADELVERAAALGCSAIAITDINTLAGIVRAHAAAKEVGIQLVVGCRLELQAQWQSDDSITPLNASGSAGTDPPDAHAAPAPARPLPPCPSATSPLSSSPLSILVYPTDRASYGRLCRMLTLGKRRAPKGECHLTLDDLIEYQEGLLAIVLPSGAPDFHDTLRRLRQVFDEDRLSLAASCVYGADDGEHLERLKQLSRETGVPLVATNDVHYHTPERRPLQDVLVCIRHICTIQEAGHRLFPNGERSIKGPDEMARLFAPCPHAIARTIEIARRAAGFSLDQLKYEYPREVCPRGRSPMAYLRELTWKGACERFVNLPGQRGLFEGGVRRDRRDERRDRRVDAGESEDVRHAPEHTQGEHRRDSFSSLSTNPPSSANSAHPSATSAYSLIPGDVVRRIEHEFELIEALDYAKYFLTVYDIVKFARSRGILCQGRGAAANSAVCYCLGITAVDPTRIDMLFERFVSKERNEPPDIDIDFEHERREEVIQYIYGKYGRDRAALCAEVVTYRGRSAIRDVGKAMGLSLDLVDRMARQLDWWDGGIVSKERIAEMGLDPEDPTIRMTLELAHEILGFPRHLSQHVGGFIITEGPLEEMVPIENAAMDDRTVIEWDKDDIDAMGMLKIDVLGLGMLTAIRKGLEFVNARKEYAEAAERTAENAESKDGKEWLQDHETSQDLVPDSNESSLRSPRPPSAPSAYSSAPLELHTVPPEDPEVYDMICKADTVGVFQIESRAQMSMLPRLRPRCYYDLVIEVAIVRPGPIQGDMVHPYLRRRMGQEPVSYPSKEIERVLGRTLGVPLFQEQAMQLAVVAAGFTPGEADHLRRAIAAWRRKPGLIESFGVKLKNGMIKNGYSPKFADQVFTQIQGFSGYGFPESHAASFALLVYISAWLKCHHPAAFAAALLNSQPMGFYAPAQLVRDAREHGVEVREVDVNASGWDCRLEQKYAEVAERNAEGAEGEYIGRLKTQGTPVTVALPSFPAPAASEFSASSAPSEFPRSSAASASHSAASAYSSPALRLGMRLIRGLGQAEALAIEGAVRTHGPFRTIEDLWRASGVRVSTLLKLARADAYNSMGLDRRKALWHIRNLRDEELPLFDQQSGQRGDISRLPVSLGQPQRPPHHPVSPHRHDDDVALPPMPADRQVIHDYATVGLSLKAHPMSFLRPALDKAGVHPCRDAHDDSRFPHNTPITLAGIVLCRQRPGTASGIVFMTIEDESGIANLIVRPKVWAAHRAAARHSVCILVRGHVERPPLPHAPRGKIIHIVVKSIEPLQPRQGECPENEALPTMSRDFH
jgi:error-prone DNA polymerase